MMPFFKQKIPTKIENLKNPWPSSCLLTMFLVLAVDLKMGLNKLLTKNPLQVVYMSIKRLRTLVRIQIIFDDKEDFKRPQKPCPEYGLGKIIYLNKSYFDYGTFLTSMSLIKFIKQNKTRTLKIYKIEADVQS